MKFYKLCIIGGGLAGLSLAYYLVSLGVKDIVIIEKSEVPGGLLITKHIRGYTFDVGGSHIIFSKDKEILNEMLYILNGNYVKHRRNSKILLDGLFIKYPFENGLKDLPPQKRFECLRDVIQAYIDRLLGKVKEPHNFLEWMYYVFGKCITDTYLRPYNEKLWKTDLRTISLEWVGGRVPNPPLEDIMKSAVGLETEGYKHQLIFYYPLRGGIYALINSLISSIKGLNLRCGEEAVRVLHDNNYNIIETSKDVIGCMYVVSTSPLNESAEMFRPILGKMSSNLRLLRAVPLVVVSLGFKGDAPPYHWVYVPTEDIIFHRFAFLSNYSPYNAPKGAVSLITEITFRDPDEATNVSNYSIVNRVIEDLEYIGILKNSRYVEVYDVTRWRNAYVIYDELRSKVLSEVRDTLNKYNIIVHGRFGLWEYLNMDVVFRKSKELASYLALKLK
ncbi:MAG: FAD-dependent oxidoreductase [Thermoprotei archaeon]|nr:MAG: FAD-dependent oxidoreductase [Thermoprotei archaeon]